MIRNKFWKKYEGLYIFIIGVLLMLVQALVFKKMPDDMMALVLTFVMFMMLTKLLYEVILGYEAPIQIRYALASLAIEALIDARIAMVKHQYENMLILLLATFIVLVLRHYAIISTKETR